MSSQTSSRAIPIGNQLSRQQRLRTPDEFQLVYKSKQWGGSDYFTFNALPITSEEETISRLGVTVSKKVAKQAVIRNRIKRQVKEFYRHKKQSLFDIDLVITAKPSCAKASDEERQQSLNLLWSKILKWQRWYTANHS